MRALLTLLVLSSAAILHVYPSAVALAPLARQLRPPVMATQLHLFLPLQLCTAPAPESSTNQTFSMRSATKRALGKIGKAFVELHTAGREWNEEMMYFDPEHPFFV